MSRDKGRGIVGRDLELTVEGDYDCVGVIAGGASQDKGCGIVGPIDK